MARTGRPKTRIPRLHYERWALIVLEDIWGGPLPSQLLRTIDPVKCIRRMVAPLSIVEKQFWQGTPFMNSGWLTIEKRLRSTIYLWVRHYHKCTPDGALAFCGFTVMELKSHLERQFETWMTWDNWGEWQVDHIIPRRLFNKPYSQSEIFGLNNLRPISRAANMAKGGRLV